MNEQQPKSDELILLVEKQDGIISALQEEIKLCREQLEIITNDRSIQDRNDAEVVELVKEAETRVLSTVQAVDFLTAENEQLKLKLEELEKGSCDDKSSMSLSKLTEKLRQLEIEVEHSRNAEKLIKQEAEVERIRNKELIEELAIARRSRSDLENRTDLRNGELQEELRKTKQTAIEVESNLSTLKYQLGEEIDFTRGKLESTNELFLKAQSELHSERTDNKALRDKIKAVSDENAELKAEIMKLKMPSHNSTDKSEHDKKAERIIHDQRKIIASLREEVSFLFAKFEQKSQHDRETIRSLKKENKERQLYIDKLLNS